MVYIELLLYCLAAGCLLWTAEDNNYTKELVYSLVRKASEHEVPGPFVPELLTGITITVV